MASASVVAATSPSTCTDTPLSSGPRARARAIAAASVYPGKFMRRARAASPSLSRSRCDRSCSAARLQLFEPSPKTAAHRSRKLGRTTGRPRQTAHINFSVRWRREATTCVTSGVHSAESAPAAAAPWRCRAVSVNRVQAKTRSAVGPRSSARRGRPGLRETRRRFFAGEASAAPAATASSSSSASSPSLTRLLAAMLGLLHLRRGGVMSSRSLCAATTAQRLPACSIFNCAWACSVFSSTLASALIGAGTSHV
mmetsp:Transcript_11432/g.30867  ORF Transcript_11432/g.30867 Transcript_11432/m.30867 type:complete len:254 (+) Transcript_11432:338-1099(+)